MIALITIFTIIFILVGFFYSRFAGPPQDVFSAHFLTELSFIKNNAFVFLLIFAAGTIAFLKSVRFNEAFSFNKKLVYSGIHVLTAAVFGCILSFFILCIIAVIQLNIFSILTNTNPEMLGIISDRKEIQRVLKNNNRPPEITATDKNPHKELLAIAQATSGKNHFYGSMILTTIPGFLVIPHGSENPSLMLLDNSLIVSEINQSDIEILSPVIGHLLVQHNFPTRKIKAYPKISLMQKAEYAEFRKRESAKKLIQIDDELKLLEDKISSVSATIELDKNQLTASKNPQSEKQVQNINVNEVNKRIIINETLLNDYRYLEKFYIAQKKLLQTLTVDASHENAAFIPQDIIKIVHKTNNPHAIADYFSTLTHEYLHYASYVSENKWLSDSFFEEGLTEYFARSAIKNDLNTSTNLGYPVQAKIISEMTNLIPESEFAEIYFTKDQEGLERALDRVYGDGFYLKNKITFETLHYATTPNRVLFLANDIMKKIGGKPLTEKDLVSTYSKL
jgi:hypothetical protein